MSWRRMAPHLYTAAKSTATGASITLGSTFISCYLAIQIERVSHRTLFAFFPHWYADVEYANGIDPDLLATVRLEAKQKRLEEQRTQQLLALAREQEAEQKTRREQEDRTKTVFTIEKFVQPGRLLPADLDLGACAMTA